MADYEAVIGLEVHVQLKTNTKMFCGCRNEFGAAPNTHTCPVCMGLPGSLPVPNEEAVVKTILTGKMLDCNIAERCKWDRKNYYYPDMPKNYQISQYDMPLCEGGAVPLNIFAFPKDAQKDESIDFNKKIGLTRIHLEEDVAKSQHFESSSGIDFNRAGTPLMEIVSEPDIASPEEAFAYLTSLRQILIYGNVSDADMEKGQLRCDVNVSVRPKGQKEFGIKVELKNLNSVSGVRRALAYEIDRQIELYEEGKASEIVQSTRRWDDVKGETFLMRVKEGSADYRYFPCPDLLPVGTVPDLQAAADKRMPELPDAKKSRLQVEYGVSEYQAGVLASERSLADYYEKAAAKSKNAKAKVTVANYLLNDYLATSDDLTNIQIKPTYFSDLANMVEDGSINSKQAKQILSKVIEENKPPAEIKDELGIQDQVTDTGAIEKMVEEAIAGNPDSVEAFKSGKEAAANKILGAVMKLSKGSANPGQVREILLAKLKAL